MPMQKAMLNRQQSAARQRPAMAPPPIQTVGQSPRLNVLGEPMNSPRGQPTPPSQRSSPSTTRSPGFPMQGMASPTTDLHPRHQYSQQRQMQPMPQGGFQQQQQRGHNRSVSAHNMGQSYPRRSIHIPVSQTQANYYPTSFQKHYDQLGKSTPIHPFQFLLGSCVRPRLNPLVQTRSMTLKLICLTMSTATTWIQIASFQISDCRRKPEVALGLECKRHHQRQPLRQAMQVDRYPRIHSNMTPCLMQILLGFLHRCTFRILMVGFKLREGDVAPSISLGGPGRALVLILITYVYTKVVLLFSEGAMAGFKSNKGWWWRKVVNVFRYYTLTFRKRDIEVDVRLKGFSRTIPASSCRPTSARVFSTHLRRIRNYMARPARSTISLHLPKSRLICAYSG